MTIEPSLSAEASWMPRTPEESLARLVAEMDRWGTVFLRLAGEGRPDAAEQAMGGLVDWMGNGLIDGWLHLPVATFEQVSDLAEELLHAFQDYLAWLRAGAMAHPADGAGRRDDLVREILARAHALTAERRS